MKTIKNFLVLFSCASVLLISGCSEDDPVPPSIDFKGGNDFVSTDVTLEPSTDFKVGITATAGDKNLSSFTVTRCCLNNETTTVVPDSSISGDNFEFESTYTTSPEEIDEKWEFTVTDKDGETASVSFTITTRVLVTTTPLSSEKDFTWERVGGAAGTGLDKFGLSWTSNGPTGASAIIKSGANKMVELSSSDWSTANTIEGLQELIDGKNDIDEYTGVSAQANSTPDDYLGTQKDSTYFIINVQTGAVVSDSIIGTTITITGKYKE